MISLAIGAPDMHASVLGAVVGAAGDNHDEHDVHACIQYVDARTRVHGTACMG